MKPLQFRVLGQLEVVGDAPLELGGPKPRVLLAQLLANCGEVVSAESLIDVLWGESPPSSAANSLQSYVSRLRKVLGSDRIESRGSGYSVQADVGEVDYLEFERLVGEGRALVDRRPDEAASILREALAMWRGRPYADTTESWQLGVEATRLDELRLAAVEDRIEADLALGKHAMVVGELEALVGEHPWRERAWGQMMTALYGAGRQAEALRAFQRARRILGEEVGIEPSPELRSIEDMILQQSPELGSPVEVEPAAPEAGMSVRGYELRAAIGRTPHGDLFRGYHASVGREVDIEVIGPEMANAPDFIRDFESTARGLGSLAHPNIVPIHDFWREPSAAYFVTGCRNGLTLTEVVARNRLNDSEVAALLDQIASALDAAHSRQLVHGNLSGSNVLIDMKGAAVLHGFQPTRPDSIASSIAADLGAFAALARELVPVGALPVSVDLSTAAQIADATRVALAVGTERSVEVERNPYKGLRAFEEADARDFFGRTALVAQLVARLAEAGPRSRFLAVVGPSGSGKSSVVKAGLADALRRGALPGAEGWFTVSMFPGAHPFAELEAALLRIAVNPPTSLLEQLEDGPLGISRAINRVLPDATSDLLLIVDQFEELFTLTSGKVRERFLRALLAALDDPRSRMRVVVTLRADFHDRPLAHHELAEWMRDRTEVVIPLTKVELEEAITGPALQMGVSVEPELVSAMVSDVVGQAGGLPLLQYALTGLFDGKTNDTMTLAQYEAGGGITGAVAARAEAIYEGLAESERKLVPQVFLRLVTVSETGEATRRRVRRSELLGSGGDRRMIAGVINAFGDHRLLTFGRDTVSRGPTVEVAHEALLTRWPRLAGWVEAATDDVRSFSKLAAAANEWVDADRSDDYLITGGRLESFAAWAERTDFELSKLEREFLDTSIARRNAARLQEQERAAHEANLERRSIRRLRTLVAVLLGAGIIGSLLTVFAFIQRSQAQQEAQLGRARALVGEAQAALDTDPELAILLALEAAEVDADVGLDAAAIIHRALPLQRTVLSLPGTTAFPSPDGSWIVTGDESGAVRIFDASSGEVVAEIGHHDGEITALVVTGDGHEIASGDAAGSVRIWDVESGSEVGGWDDLLGGAVEMVRVTPDRQSLVVATASGPATIRDRSGTVVHELQHPLVPPDGEQSVDLTEEGTRALTPNGHFEVATGELVAATVFAGEHTTHGVANAAGDLEYGAGGPVAAGGRYPYEDASGHVWFDFGSTVSALAIDDPGNRVAVGTAGGTAIIWETEFGNTLFELSGHTSEVSVVEFMEGDRFLTASPDGTTRVWDLSGAVEGEVLNLDAAGCCSIGMDLSGDGSVVAVASWNEPVQLFDTVTGDQLGGFLWGIPENGSWDAALSLSADSSTLLGAKGPGLIWDVATERKLTGSTDALEGTYFAALAPNATHGAFAVGESVEIHALGSDEPPVVLAASGEVTDVAYAPDGKLLLIADSAGLMLADPAAQQTASRIVHPGGRVPKSIAFSQDGRRVAATWEEGGVSAFSLDGAMIFDHEDTPGAVDVVFAGDESVLAVLFWDGRLELIDPETGRLIVTIAEHTDNGSQVAVSDDGLLLATASWDGTVRVYTMDEEELFDIARSRLTRDFSLAECQQYLLDSCDASATR